MEYFSTKNQWIFVPPRNHLCIESEQNPTLWTTKLLNPRGLQNNSTMENLNFDISIFFRVTFWSWIGYFLQDLWRFPSLQISANFTASHSSVRMSDFYGAKIFSLGKRRGLDCQTNLTFFTSHVNCFCRGKRTFLRNVISFKFHYFRNSGIT